MVGDNLIDIGTRDIVLDYQAAYVLASKTLGKHCFTVRGDWFETTHLGSDLSEDGWAATLAYSYAVAEKQRLFLELLDIDSYRESREALGHDEDASDLQFQIGYRLFFDDVSEHDNDRDGG